ncbi:uncharacterized protein isoform X1 [Rhodnius prolixus]|uniref:G patch domain-containing protein 4 n=1 Tax=Rhodnius prolixus TaxID=13249 RepID=T1HHJ0_RHOPR
MNFAKRELFKYGWKEGKGLGKESTGTVEPVRPKLKFDNKGLGFNYGEEYSFKWWEHVYDQAANNISVISAEDGTKSLISTKYKKSTPITTQKKKSSRKFKSKKKDTTLKVVNDIPVVKDIKRNDKVLVNGKLMRLLIHENKYLLSKEKVDTCV